MRYARASSSKSDPITAVTLDHFIEERRGKPLTVLLDYDGTLVPIAETPDRAAPDAELLSQLAALAGRAEIDLHLVSGRPRETMERWFGTLRAALWAEHGFWYRPAWGGPWEAAERVASEWLTKIRPIIEHFTTTTPGSLIEDKTAGIAWHYRLAEPGFGARQAEALRVLLEDALFNKPLTVLEGKKVIEVRPRAVSKALVARRVASLHGPARAILAIGDDQTDEDLFGSLPDPSVTVAVGDGRTCARYSVKDSLAVRALLNTLVG